MNPLPILRMITPEDRKRLDAEIEEAIMIAKRSRDRENYALRKRIPGWGERVQKQWRESKRRCKKNGA